MSHSISLSVSVLNVLLNLFVMLLLIMGAEIAHYALYKSTQLQLKRRGVAPFITEPDDAFSHFRNRLAGARKSHSLLNMVFVLVSASLFFGEICSEVGVDASHRCEPRMHPSVGLCADPFHHIMSDSRVITNAYHTRIARWDNHELQSFPVYEGFRKNFNGRESFSHPPSNKSQRVVVAGCASSDPLRIAAYDAVLTISQSMNVWQTFVSRIATPNGSSPLVGFGDLTTNGKTMSAFLVVPSPDESSHARVKILEYHPTAHRKELSNLNGLSSTADHVIRNKEYMVTYNVSCTHFAHSSEMFARALQVYRSVQLEDPEYTIQNVSIDGFVDKSIPCMNGSDAVRAAITLALMNEKSCAGETFEYTECGVYHWKFLAPLLILFGFVVIFAVTNGLLVMMEDADVEIPHSASAWSALALQYNAQTATDGTAEGPSDSAADIFEAKTFPRGYYQLCDRPDGGKEVVLQFKPPPQAGRASKTDRGENIDEEV